MTGMGKRPCYRNAGDCIEGDQIYVRAMKPGKWVLIRKSNQHNAMKCIAKKDAKAELIRAYTNVKK